MKSINAHLTLPGTAREAVTFYREILGGEAQVVPTDSDKLVFHADLQGENFRLMAADGEVPRLALHIACEEEAEMARLVDE